jgi:hypothetical protein
LLRFTFDGVDRLLEFDRDERGAQFGEVEDDQQGATDGPGANIVILNIALSKNSEKKLATKITAMGAISDHNIVF